MKLSKKHMFLLISVFLILVVIILSLIFMPFNRNPKDIEAKELSIPFAQAIDTINTRVVDLTALSDLLGIEEFLSILASSDNYLSEAQAYLKDTAFSEQQKTIVVYSMQNLSYWKYIQFFNDCANLYEEKRISANVMISVIAPSDNWNHKVSNSFLKYKVRKTLKVIRKIKRNPKELNDVIDMTLSGKLWFYGLLQ
jgi:prolyl oligopeptidase PreP (S9A serine peptidase family)